jgi:hypothetical protein
VKSKSLLCPRYLLPFITLYMAFFLSSCGVVGAGNDTTQYSVFFSPSALAFGNVSAGTSARKTVTLSNTGKISISIVSANVTGSGFSIEGLSFPLTLQAASNTSFAVVFKPISSGPVTGRFSITSNLNPLTTATLGLSGTGVSASPAATPAQIAVSPANVSFGSIPTASTATQYVSVSNTGDATLKVSNVSVTGTSFAESGPVPPFTVAAGQSQTLAINFAPAISGIYSGSLVISSDAANNIGPVALSGTAMVPTILTLSASPTSVSFPSVVVGNNATQNVTLTNTGNSAVTVSSGTATGSGFSVISPTFPVTIPAGQTQQVSIRFAPSSSGSVTGSASFVSNATNSPAVVSLSGTGTAAPTPPQIAVSPGSIAFGSILVNTTATQPLTVTNTGGSLLTISQITLNGDAFAESGPVAPFTVAAGQSQGLMISFAPTATGTYTGSLSITSDAPNSLSPVGISGSAAAVPILTLGASPSSLAFGNVTVGSSSSQNATLTNTGNSTVTVFSANVSGAGFTVTSPAFPVTIPAGGSQQVGISFAPQASGGVSGSVSFVSNASNSPASVSLTGTGTVAVQHSVDLAWSASSSVVVGYKVYRGTQSGGPYTVLNSTLDASTAYTDSTVQSGQTYYYVVTAVDGSGNESAYSNQATAVVP